MLKVVVGISPEHSVIAVPSISVLLLSHIVKWTHGVGVATQHGYFQC